MQLAAKIVLASMILTALGGCRGVEKKEDDSSVTWVIRLSQVQLKPTGPVEPGQEIELPKESPLKSYVVFDNAPPGAKIRFRCPDGNLGPEVEMPFDGQPHDTGCKTPGGKPIRLI